MISPFTFAANVWSSTPPVVAPPSPMSRNTNPKMNAATMAMRIHFRW
jgi:hypothetical protein